MNGTFSPDPRVHNCKDAGPLGEGTRYFCLSSGLAMAGLDCLAGLHRSHRIPLLGSPNITEANNQQLGQGHFLAWTSKERQEEGLTSWGKGD